MKNLAIKDAFKIAGLVTQVGLAVLGSYTIAPSLARNAVLFGLAGSLLAFYLVMKGSKADFKRRHFFFREPYLSFALAVFFYAGMQCAAYYFDYHTPVEMLAILADILIQVLFALSLSCLAMSACSLLRDLGINPIEYLHKDQVS